ncbi:MAG: hypothetical protein OEX97_02430 [Acidimicrobiia bacterium]|nr:hypothetical protein [Acidimicrobiia bacterium]
MRRTIVILVVLAMVVGVLALPAYAVYENQLARSCSTLVGIKSKTTGDTWHKAFNGGTSYYTGDWENGGTYTYRWSISNHTHLYDAAGFGSRVSFTLKAWTPYNYCSLFL